MAFNDTRNDTQSNELNQETGSHHEPSTTPAPSTSNPNPETNSSERPKVGSTRSDKETMTEDFATALETFEQEQSELAANEDRVLKGTVIGINPNYLVVDIGLKSEGVVPLAEVHSLFSELNTITQPEKVDVVVHKGMADNLHWPMVLAILALLCVEWSIRKRKGLV